MPENEHTRPCPPPPPPPREHGRPAPPAPLAPLTAADDGLREACRRSGISLEPAPHRLRLRSVEPILQSGPSCGPVALSMLLGREMPPETLVGMAREAGFSNNGEIFSCQFMERLAREAAKCIGLPLEINIKDNLFDISVVRELLDGAALLVPYDSDRNFAPCLRRGHKAHWALIVGVLELKGTGEDSAVDMDNVYALARHGKSRHLAAWRLAELGSSNANLREFPPQREGDGLRYVVPEGGVAGDAGLCSRYVLVRGL